MKRASKAVSASGLKEILDKGRTLLLGRVPKRGHFFIAQSMDLVTEMKAVHRVGRAAVERRDANAYVVSCVETGMRIAYLPIPSSFVRGKVVVSRNAQRDVFARALSIAGLANELLPLIETGDDDAAKKLYVAVNP